MKAIAHGHSLKELSVFVCQLVVDVEIPDSLAISELGDLLIDAVDDWHHRHVVIARKDAHQNDRCVGSLLSENIKNGIDATWDLAGSRIIHLRGLFADIICAGQQHNDLWIDVIKLTIVEAP